MDFDTWLLCVASALLLSATPGPNLLHVLDRSVTYGLLAAFALTEGLRYLAFALAAQCIAGYLRVSRWGRRFDRGVGSLFIGLGAALLATG